MPTIADIIREVTTIREIVDMIEIKGNKNAELITAAYLRCNGLIDTLKNAAKTIEQQNTEAGENNG